MIRVYLAGPCVFLPEPEQRFAAMKRICRRHGVEGVSPLDPLPALPGADPRSIAARNEAHIRACHAVIANLTPFRGPGADPGTVYELGFARALGRPLFGYAAVAADAAARARALPGSTASHDANGLAIEDFGLYENLMVACAIEASGGFILAEEAPPWTDLSVFGRCVAQAATVLLSSPALVHHGSGPEREPSHPVRSPP